MRILVTGSSGFVGTYACIELHKRGFLVRAFSRSYCEWPDGIEGIQADNLSSLLSFCPAFEGVDCILHLAGRAHIIKDFHPNPLHAFREANVDETLGFARAAAVSGVRRFIFVSTVKVNGQITKPNSPFTENDISSPLDPYAISKLEAEIGLESISAETGMELVIVRPPLIYGPKVKGNLNLLINLLKTRLPLPFALATNNRRSYVSLFNLVDFLVLCSQHDNAVGKVFFVSDQSDISTAQLLRKIASVLGFAVILYPVPMFLLRFFAWLFRKESSYIRLCGSLVVDSSAATRELGWTPPISLDDGLKQAFVDIKE